MQKATLLLAEHLQRAVGDDEFLVLATLASAVARPDPDQVLALVDRAAEQVHTLLEAKKPEPESAISVLNQVFFEEYAFSGTPIRNYHPLASDLTQAVAQREGIPITLVVLYTEIARRVQLPVIKVNFPGHFLAAWVDETNFRTIDVHGGGVWFTQKEREEKLKKLYGEDTRLNAETLEPAKMRPTLLRILNNLKSHYLRKQQIDQAAEIIERILLIDPRRHSEYRDRGLIYHASNRYLEALADLQQYLKKNPQAYDADTIQALIEELRHMQLKVN